MKSELAAVAIIAALVVGVGVGYSGIAGSAATRTVTTTTTLMMTSTASTTTSNSSLPGTNSVSGLSLELSLNSTSIQTGHGIAVNVEELNTMPEANTVKSSRSWPLEGLSIGPCGSLNLPIGIAIFQGYYAANNVTTAQPLALNEPGSYSCPAIFNIAAYAFQPDSVTAGVLTGGSSTPAFTANMSATVAARGSWSGSQPQNAVFSTFSTGVYTVVGGDEWGSMVICHFSVGS